MLRKLYLSLPLLACCSSAPSAPPQTPTKTVIPTEVTFHGDVDFTEAERKDILAAASAWQWQTGGAASVTVVFDLDFTSALRLKELKDDNLLGRFESTMDAIVQEDCNGAVAMGLPCGGPQAPRTLGFVSPPGGIHNPWQKPLRMALVVDRLGEPGALLQVTMHEFGHALGVPHGNTVGGVMYPAYIPFRKVCLKRSDVNAFCLVNDCDAGRLVPCD